MTDPHLSPDDDALRIRAVAITHRVEVSTAHSEERWKIIKDYAAQAWPLVLAASAIMMITMGVRQSLGLFVSPINSVTGLGIVRI